MFADTPPAAAPSATAVLGDGDSVERELDRLSNERAVDYELERFRGELGDESEAVDEQELEPAASVIPSGGSPRR